VATNLSDGTVYTIANSVFVQGNDVYVTGFEYNGTTNIAKIWKNGVVTNLTDATQFASAKSIFVVER
ncbi:MAG: hypothetical protein K1X26_09245, partial [Chitinophagales bacterium]|nr:hypothetical protein [Chitinophagales bacterium]